MSGAGDPGRHGAVGCRVHERVRAADEDVPRRARQEGQDLGDHRGVDAPAVVARAPRGLARQGQGEREAVPAVVQVEQLVAEGHVVPAARRQQQCRRHVGGRRPAVPEHRHERDHARAGADQQQRPAVRDGPDEVAAQRPAQLDLVAEGDHLVEEGRDLAVLEELDRQLDAARVLGRRRDRVAAHRAVAVGCREPHVDVLPGPEGERPRRCQDEALDARRPRDDPGHDRLLPGRGRRRLRRHVSRPCSAARATGRRTCGSRAAPRSRPRPAR